MKQKDGRVTIIVLEMDDRLSFLFVTDCRFQRDKRLDLACLLFCSSCWQSRELLCYCWPLFFVTVSRRLRWATVLLLCDFVCRLSCLLTVFLDTCLACRSSCLLTVLVCDCLTRWFALSGCRSIARRHLLLLLADNFALEALGSCFDTNYCSCYRESDRDTGYFMKKVQAPEGIERSWHCSKEICYFIS